MEKFTVVITYDIENGQTEVKAELKKLGYLDTIDGELVDAPHSNVTINLPNTTLAVTRVDMTPQKALDEFYDVVFKLNILRSPKDIITVERLFACVPSGWRAQIGDSDRT